MLRKGGCAWWAVFIIAVLTFLIGFLWGSAASSRTAGSPVADVPVPPIAPVVTTSPKAETVKTEPVASPKAEPVPQPAKTEPIPQPVKVPDPPKVEQPNPQLAPKVEPVDIEGISDDAWKSARVTLRKGGSIAGVDLLVPAGSTVKFHLPKGFGVRDSSLNALVVRGAEKPTTVVIQGMRIFVPAYSGNDGNGLIVAVLGSQQFSPKIVDNKVNILVPDSQQRFAYPDLGGDGFGNLTISFFSPQKFTEMEDKKLFVRLYIEWMALHPSRETNTDEAVDLLHWWNSHQSAK